MNTATFHDGILQSLPENYLEHFLDYLRAAGYAERTLRKKRSVTTALARWMKRKRITTDQFDESHIDAFVARSPRGRKDHVKRERAVIRLLLRYLRSATGLQGGRPCRRTLPPVTGFCDSMATICARTADLRRTRFMCMSLSFVLYSPLRPLQWAAHRGRRLTP